MRVKCEHLTCCDFYWVIIAHSWETERSSWSEIVLGRSWKFRVSRDCLHVIWALSSPPERSAKKNELKIYISWELVMLLHTKNKKNIAIVSRAPLCVVSNYHKLKLKLRHISHQIASKQIYTQKNDEINSADFSKLRWTYFISHNSPCDLCVCFSRQSNSKGK